MRPGVTSEHPDPPVRTGLFPRLFPFYNANLDPAWVFDAETGRILGANDAALKAYGYTEEEFLGLRLHDMRPEEDIPRLEAHLKDVASRGVNRSHWRHRIKGGGVIDVEITSQPVEVEGRPARLVLARDITERLRTEAELLRTRERMRYLLYSSPAVIFAADTEFPYAATFVGENVLQQTGFTADEFLGDPGLWTSRIHPEDHARVMEERTAVFERGECHHEYRFLHRDGEYRGLRIDLRLVKDDGGRPIELIGSSIDISDRLRAEREIARKNRMISAIIEASSALVVVLDRSGRVIEFNPACEDATGYTMGDVAGRPIIDALVPAEDRDRVRAAFSHLVTAGGRSAMECDWLTRSGERRRVTWSNASLEGHDGSVQYVVSIGVDITDRLRAEEDVRRSQRFLEATLDAISGQIAILDEDGKIIAVNERWRHTREQAGAGGEAPGLGWNYLSTRFAVQAAADGDAPGIGWNYLEACLGAGAGASGDDARAIAAGLQRLLAGEEDFFVSEFACHDEKEKHWFVARFSRFEIEGRPRIVVTHFDSTARRLAEEALRESEERWHLAVEGSNDAIWDWNILTGEAYASKRAREMLGYEGENDTGTYEGWLRELHPEDRPIVEHLVAEHCEGRIPFFQSQYRMRCKDGSYKWILGRGRVLRDASGRPVRMCGSRTDITESVHTQERLRRQLRHLSSLRAIETAVSSSFDMRMTFTVLLDQLTTHLEIDAANILVPCDDGAALEFAAGKGFLTNSLRHPRLAFGEGLAGKAALERRMLRADHLRSHTDFFRRSPHLAEEGFASYIAVPLVARGETRGVIEMFHRTPILRDDEWFEFLEAIAASAAIGIDNANLFAAAQKSNLELMHAYDETIEGWSRALDLRDRETEGHSQRVTALTLRLARRIGMDSDQLVHVRRGSLLHDIGKMGVPDDILLKPGPLAQAEWDVMHRHPVFAYEMLHTIAYLAPAVEIPYCHHEKWDGTGYPRGLKSIDIPLAARVFAVVDIWDALRSDRPYRKAWTPERAIEHLKSITGTHLEPRIVEAFLDMMQEEAMGES